MHKDSKITNLTHPLGVVDKRISVTLNAVDEIVARTLGVVDWVIVMPLAQHIFLPFFDVGFIRCVDVVPTRIFLVITRRHVKIDARNIAFQAVGRFKYGE